MDKFNHQEIEAKWHQEWQEENIYRTGEDKSKPKYYVLDMFPYPSGAGLHVGHPKGYIATDILARMKMMQGFNVLHPMGWDAFGLPAENFALKNKTHPAIQTAKNIATFKSQLGKIGLTYDWEREINTTDPEYYKWTQWAFIKMWEKDLAHESFEPIIWCPSCQTGLAMEDLEDGKCERCGSEVERKPMRQWVIKITEYADRLLADLDKLTGWEDSIKEMQRNWIGRSEGAQVNFELRFANYDLEKNSPIICHPERSVAESKDPLKLTVFTTRPDTLFGVTYVVLAPEHPLIKNEELRIKNLEEVKKYINEAKKKSDLERTDLNKDKSGVKLDGVTAINPANGEEVPVFIADYVLANYGTGAVMAVPAHDERDFEFVQNQLKIKNEKLKIKFVVEPELVTVLNFCFEVYNDKYGKFNSEEKDDWSNLGDIVYFLKCFTEEQKVKIATLSIWASKFKEFNRNFTRQTTKYNLPEHEVNYYIFELVTWWSSYSEKNKKDWDNFNKAKAENAPEEYINSLWKELQNNSKNALNELILNERIVKLIIDKKIALPIVAADLLNYSRDLFVFDDDGFSINSDFLNGLPTVEAKTKMIEWLEEKGFGKKKVNYKLNDWVFSRQRYWGEPIPFVHCEKCGTVPVAEKDLPVKLPQVEHYEPTGTGESPLANITDWVNTTCPKCGGPAKRETNTMPQWAGSSWYYLRYIDPHNNEALVDMAKEKYWSPVDFYVGGAEHATRHLIYARFWHKFLFDIGVVNYDEPFTRLQHVGLIMAEDGRKMSKRWGNVINPDDIIEKFGADAMRVYEMFMGPFGAACAWNTNGLTGARKFLDRIWAISHNAQHITHNVDERINGVGALIQLENGNFIFQERDENTDRNPGMIAPFGGGIKEGESFEKAMERELKEEIDLTLDNAKEIGDFESHIEKGKFIKLFYIKIFDKNGLRLKEGKSIVELSLDEALKNKKVTEFTKEVLKKYQGDKEIKSLLHKTIKKVTEDITEFKFNTCISALMILSNKIEEQGISSEDFAKFIQILAPFAPHLAEEIWREKLGNKESIFSSESRGGDSAGTGAAAWPKFDPELIKDETVNLVVQINGKLRATILVPAEISQDEAMKLAQENENVKKWLFEREIMKIIFVPGKLLNIVIK